MRQKHFLKLPEYPGGKEEFRKYILENLKYPDEAVKNSIEGIVHLVAEINDNGEVIQAKVVKGIGYGCDEEALRLISDLQFGGVRNRGLRVKTKKKFRIQFKLKKEQQKEIKNQASIQYSIKPEKKSEEKVQKPNAFSYTIDIQ